ncbi:MAG: GGDEF domain-containing protein [Lachnospiraceae bacterium]|nr:GGDEF domain-containing protein [Lachnospiraceae bacterium]
MVQKKYTFHTFDELEAIVDGIQKSDLYQKATGVLFQLYNPKLDLDDERIVDYINATCSNACLVGITAANVVDEEFDIKDCPAELNAVFFSSGRLIEFDFDTSIATGFAAGRIIHEQLDNIPNAKCMLICYSCGSAVIHSFISEFRHHQIPIFGIMSGGSIRANNTAKVYGKRVHSNGIIAIIMSGRDLHLYMDNCLGFREIGVEMAVTKTQGDNIISEIDHKPATEVYSKYLKVSPNRYFMHNVCEFPMVFHRNDCAVARVPTACDEKGMIHFTSDVIEGEKFRLSYGNPENLFYTIRESVKGLKEFRPQAVFLYECGNRMRFLRDKANCEIESYTSLYPQTSVAVGFAELFISSEENGCAMNSALVAVGLSEDPSAKDSIRNGISLNNMESEANVQNYVPLVDRILTFLETTAAELDSINKELGRIAYTDQLTRIYNRWELENKVNDVLESCQRDKRPASIIFMDIDHFKRVNDNFGHDVGDMVLRESVDLVKNSLKPQHIFGRWGGEEFIYVIPESHLEEAKSFAEMLRKQIEENCFAVVEHITMSFGVTEYRAGDNLEAFVKRADNALYMAKEGGRNRVCSQ